MTRPTGRTLVLTEPLSLWGGVDPSTSEIVEGHHPQLGERLAGRIVVMSAGRGSSSSASVLAELVRGGVAPAAIVIGEPDLILSIGSAVAEELYGVEIPVLVRAPERLAGIRDGTRVRIGPRGGLSPEPG